MMICAFGRMIGVGGNPQCDIEGKSDDMSGLPKHSSTDEE